MSEQFQGTVAEVGGKEMSKDGTKEKPRKVVVKKSPTDQFGKTFRVWPNSDDFQVLRQAADSGTLVTVEFDVNQIPGTEYTQNMVTHVYVENGEGGDNGSGWGAPQENSWDAPAVTQEPQQASPSRVWGSAREDGAPAATSSSSPSVTSKDDYWAKRDALDEVRTREIEAAWALGVLLPHVGNNPDALKREALILVALKHQVAAELADG